MIIMLLTYSLSLSCQAVPQNSVILFCSFPLRFLKFLSEQIS